MSTQAEKKSPQALLQTALAECLTKNAAARAPLCVAFSGGVDSSVLLHALRQVAAERGVRAVHIDHGLHAASSAWTDSCRQFCAELNVPFTAIRVQVATDSGMGTEAAAREQRYAALLGQILPGEFLLTAHHQQDQLETLLLQLLRGAGIQGLAAMPMLATRGPALLLRPLLGVPVEDILAYARAEKLHWIDDPSNADLSMDRNYLRHEVLPLLAGRWPAGAAAVARSARLCAEAAAILDEVAEADLAGILSANRVSLSGLQQLSPPRQRNALRCALRLLGLAIPSEKQLRQSLQTLLTARDDAQPEAAWPGVRIRRYRKQLWFYSEQDDPAAVYNPADRYAWQPGNPLDMGSVRGRLSSEPLSGGGIAAEYCGEMLEVRFRQGGEKLRPESRGRTRELKNLLQESNIVPWMRGHIPLIYAGNQLLAAGNIWVNNDFAAAAGEAGVGIIWQDHAAIR